MARQVWPLVGHISDPVTRLARSIEAWWRPAETQTAIAAGKQVDPAAWVFAKKFLSLWPAALAAGTTAATLYGWPVAIL